MHTIGTILAVLAAAFAAFFFIDSRYVHSDVYGQLAYGQTNPTAGKWTRMSGGCELKVDTSSANFKPGSIPKYFTSITGTKKHWEARGVSAIYSPTHKSFIVNIMGLPCSMANGSAYSINWNGISER